MAGTARQFNIGWSYRDDLVGATDEIIVPAPLRGTQTCIEIVRIHVAGGGSEIILAVQSTAGVMPISIISTTSQEQNYLLWGPIVLETESLIPGGDFSELVFTNSGSPTPTSIHVTAEWVNR